MNPYANRQGIRDADAFYGRDREIKDLFTRLSAMQSCSLVGPRRIGKSSLLYYITHPNIYRQRLADHNKYVFAFLDLQELIGLEPDSFFAVAVEMLSLAAKSSQVELVRNADLERGGSMRGFRHLLMRLRQNDLRLVLCLDEFEMLSNNTNFGVSFFTYLRGLCSNYNLALVTSSRTSLYELCHQGNIQTSQFWNIFVELGLGLMPENESLELIRKPFIRVGKPLNDEEINFIQKWAGDHPFFIQTVCYHLFLDKEETTKSHVTDLEEIKRLFLIEATPHYAYAWRHFNKIQQDILKRLVTEDVESLYIAEPMLASLTRQTVLTGTAIKPFFSSSGWQWFVEQQIDIESTFHNRALPQKYTLLSSLSVSSEVTLPQLRQLMTKVFNENELQDICFDLNIDYQLLTGDEKGSKIRELILYTQRNGRLSELLTLCTQLRPRETWSIAVSNDL